jgi:hypothetical protein
MTYRDNGHGWEVGSSDMRRISTAVCSPPLLPCLPPFIVSMIGLPPRHILRQGDPPRGDACIPRILHKNAYALRKQKLARSDENECEQTYPWGDDPSP